MPASCTHAESCFSEAGLSSISFLRPRTGGPVRAIRAIATDRPDRPAERPAEGRAGRAGRPREAWPDGPAARPGNHGGVRGYRRTFLPVTAGGDSRRATEPAMTKRPKSYAKDDRCNTEASGDQREGGTTEQQDGRSSEARRPFSWYAVHERTVCVPDSEEVELGWCASRFRFLFGWWWCSRVDLCHVHVSE